MLIFMIKVVYSMLIFWLGAPYFVLGARCSVLAARCPDSRAYGQLFEDKFGKNGFASNLILSMIKMNHDNYDNYDNYDEYDDNAGPSF